MLQIYNTLTRSKENFLPLRERTVRLYVCGMTTYDYCHLGHARVMLAFDVIVRYLRAEGFNVIYVRNITDVDDKILQRAHANGEDYTKLSGRFIEAMHEDERALNILPPDQEPRATQYIREMIAMIETLLDKGFAYCADNGDVYYSIKKFSDYGKLSNKKLDDLLAGVRITPEPSKCDPRDFALWKAAPETEPGWPSPWGWGRPGWHIECSAMSTCCLGPHFDIHGGGPDLIFPHHENEIAQAEAATGTPYAKVWMHAGAVRVDGEKMSKSLGNFFTIREILHRYHPEIVRYFLISSHYRSAINYSEQALKEAQAALVRLYTALKPFQHIEPGLGNSASEYVQAFRAAMDDDFNTPKAIAVLFELARELNSRAGTNSDDIPVLAAQFKALAEQLGILQTPVEQFLQYSAQVEDTQQIATLIQQRAQAKQNKDFARADAIRDQLKAMGISLEDTATGTHWRRL